MSAADLAWATGVLESAGCFSIVRAPNGQAWTAPRYQLQGGRALLRAVRAALGRGRLTGAAYSVTGGNLAAIARTLLPHVRSRRSLFAVLAAWPPAPAGRPSREHTLARHRAALRISKELDA